jgi:hypothetical protein
VSLTKLGLYGFNASPARVKVIDGRAEVLPVKGDGHVTAINQVDHGPFNIIAGVFTITKLEILAYTNIVQ